MGRLLIAADGSALSINCLSLSFACPRVWGFFLWFAGFVALFIISVLSLPAFIYIPEAGNGNRQ
jgi:hypothetical protein